MGSRISKRYAKALLSLGKEDGRYEEYGRNLQEFNRFCAENPEFFQVISNPIFSVEDRKKVLDVVLEKSGFSGICKSFLRLLLDKDRIRGIGDITEYYTRFTDEISNITRAEVITAMPLKKKASDKLKKACPF